MKEKITAPAPERPSPGFRLLRAVFIASFFAVGLFYEITAAICSAALCAVLILQRRQGRLRLRLGLPALAFGAVWLFYLIGCLWAVDSGIALWGCVKFLPAVLMLLCLTQILPEERACLLADLPAVGSVMTLLSYLLQFIPAAAGYFSVSSRLCGFFEYPNTFACFLLLGLLALILRLRECPRRMEILMAALLSFGILCAGSRTVFICSVPLCLAALILRRDFKRILCLLGGIAVGVGLGLISGKFVNSAPVEHITAISVSSGTFLARLLYYKDALPVILKHPFGLGYLGYYFTQGSFQTGMYAVRYVHNGLLQLALDVGWIPAVLAAAAVLRALFSRRTNAAQKLILLGLMLHAMLDFDLQFIAMYFILLLCMDLGGGQEKHLPCNAFILPAALLAAFSLYIGIAASLTETAHHEAALRLYPADTLSQLALLPEKDTAEEMYALGEDILSRNESAALAWDALAQYAYSQGDFGEVIRCKRKAIALTRYDINEYIDYYQKLAIGISLYEQAGDSASAARCIEEFRWIGSAVDAVNENTDALASQLADNSPLELPQEYYDYVEALDD